MDSLWGHKFQQFYWTFGDVQGIIQKRIDEVESNINATLQTSDGKRLQEGTNPLYYLINLELEKIYMYELKDAFLSLKRFKEKALHHTPDSPRGLQKYLYDEKKALLAKMNKEAEAEVIKEMARSLEHLNVLVGSEVQDPKAKL